MNDYVFEYKRSDEDGELVCNWPRPEIPLMQVAEVRLGSKVTKSQVDAMNAYSRDQNGYLEKCASAIIERYIRCRSNYASHASEDDLNEQFSDFTDTSVLMSVNLEYYILDNEDDLNWNELDFVFVFKAGWGHERYVTVTFNGADVIDVE